MQNFQQSKVLCDVTVMVGREEYFAHRSWLRAVHILPMSSKMKINRQQPVL